MLRNGYIKKTNLQKFRTFVNATPSTIIHPQPPSGTIGLLVGEVIILGVKIQTF